MESYSERFGEIYRFDFNTPMSANIRFAMRDLEDFPELEIPKKRDGKRAYTRGGINVNAASAVLEADTEHAGGEYDVSGDEYGSAGDKVKDTLADRILRSGGMIGNLYNVTRFRKSEAEAEAVEAVEKSKADTPPDIRIKKIPVLNFAAFEDLNPDGDRTGLVITEDLTYASSDDSI